MADDDFREIQLHSEHQAVTFPTMPAWACQQISVENALNRIGPAFVHWTSFGDETTSAHRSGLQTDLSQGHKSNISFEKPLLLLETYDEKSFLVPVTACDVSHEMKEAQMTDKPKPLSATNSCQQSLEDRYSGPRCLSKDALTFFATSRSHKHIPQSVSQRPCSDQVSQPTDSAQEPTLSQEYVLASQNKIEFTHPPSPNPSHLPDEAQDPGAWGTWRQASSTSALAQQPLHEPIVGIPKVPLPPLHDPLALLDRNVAMAGGTRAQATKLRVTLTNVQNHSTYKVQPKCSPLCGMKRPRNESSQEKQRGQPEVEERESAPEQPQWKSRSCKHHERPIWKVLARRIIRRTLKTYNGTDKPAHWAIGRRRRDRPRSHKHRSLCQ